VSALGADLFGDKVNLYSGALEFLHTDVDIPGNNALPVMVGRRLSTGGEVFANKQFGTWDLEIPHLHGTYTTWKGWDVPFPSPDRPAGSRCSNFQPPPSVPGSGAGQPSNFTPDEYWHGHQMYIPGQGDQVLLRRGVNYTDGPKDGQNYPVVTQGLWALRCLASLANDTSPGKTMGEGFIAVSPDGTEYRFDWFATRPAQTLYKPGNATFLTTSAESNSSVSAALTTGPNTPNAFTSGLLSRSEVWIMPTVVTDRFGNTVTYTYDTARPWQLKSIQSSDDRHLSMAHGPGCTAMPTGCSTP
jgi:YD repeat-containing protein